MVPGVQLALDRHLWKSGGAGSGSLRPWEGGSSHITCHVNCHNTYLSVLKSVDVSPPSPTAGEKALQGHRCICCIFMCQGVMQCLAWIKHLFNSVFPNKDTLGILSRTILNCVDSSTHHKTLSSLRSSPPSANSLISVNTHTRTHTSYVEVQEEYSTAHGWELVVKGILYHSQWEAERGRACRSTRCSIAGVWLYEVGGPGGTCGPR